jgi:beta-1,2-mannobiose phosphorylase / 1,2-beta-oligomannan phosphorylase
VDFELLDDEAIETRAGEPLASFYQLSPFVWRQDGALHAMIRAVPHDENPAKKIAQIYYGVSPDGLVFEMDARPAIAPGPGVDDRDGCEDPTVAVVAGNTYVYYTGWNEARLSGVLMLASGSDARHLQKRGVALASQADRLNPKEAEIALARDKTWHLFFEYAAGNRSCIGRARSNDVAGPWQVGDPPFERREAAWDSWHLSTGPVVAIDDGAVMFYNGATSSAKWRIGWICFDRDYRRVVERCDGPLVTPPQPKEDETDIAFAASAVTDGDLIRLYYSVADQHMRRASLRVRR